MKSFFINKIRNLAGYAAPAAAIIAAHQTRPVHSDHNFSTNRPLSKKINPFDGMFIPHQKDPGKWLEPLMKGNSKDSAQAVWDQFKGFVRDNYGRSLRYDSLEGKEREVLVEGLGKYFDLSPSQYFSREDKIKFSIEAVEHVGMKVLGFSPSRIRQERLNEEIRIKAIATAIPKGQIKQLATQVAQHFLEKCKNYCSGESSTERAVIRTALNMEKLVPLFANFIEENIRKNLHSESPAYKCDPANENADFYNENHLIIYLMDNDLAHPLRVELEKGDFSKIHVPDSLHRTALFISFNESRLRAQLIKSVNPDRVCKEFSVPTDNSCWRFW